MNPLDFIPKFVWAALVVALAATSCKLKVDNNGLSFEIEKNATRIAELKESISTSNAQAAIAGADMERKTRAAIEASKVRERVLAADANSARTELAGLRLAVAKASGGFGLRQATNPLGSNLEYTDPFPELFLQCSERYIGLAGKADGHTSDIKTLIDSWPVNK